MRLNDSYDYIRNQILMMEHFSYVNKAYSMVLRVKKQQEVHTTYTDMTDNVVIVS